MSEENKIDVSLVWIYALVDPRSSEVRYVGKAHNPEQRLRSHIAHESAESTLRAAWIRELLSEGEQPTILLLERVPETKWQESEKRWYSFYKSQGANLTNSRDGGGGGRNKSKGSVMYQDGGLLYIEIGSGVYVFTNPENLEKVQGVRWRGVFRGEKLTRVQGSVRNKLGKATTISLIQRILFGDTDATGICVRVGSDPYDFRTQNLSVGRKNKVRIDGEIAYLELSSPNGKVETSIDSADLDLVQSVGVQWKTLETGYVFITKGRKGKPVYLHNFLMQKTPTGKGTGTVDHIDRNPRNNCHSNLRIVTQAENSQNRDAQSNSKTGIRGVFEAEVHGYHYYVARVSFLKDGKRGVAARYFPKNPEGLERAAREIILLRAKNLTHSDGR